jgi:hypothetical protein
MATTSHISTQGALARALLPLAILAFAFAPTAANAGAPVVTGIFLTNGGHPFAGDNRLLTTISPNGDGLRDQATLHFRLSTAATVHLKIAQVTAQYPEPVSFPELVRERTVQLGAGSHALVWAPPARTEPRTYLALLTVNGVTYGALRHAQAGRLVTPVIRVRGVDAGFTRESYAADSTARLVIATDARHLRLDIIRSGPGHDPRVTNIDVFGPTVAEGKTFAWNHPNAAHALKVPIGDLPTGLYFVRLTADDRRVGYAPFIVRPRRLGENRVAVVLPTFTWQAYNFEDENGDGWGDTWYASWSPKATVRLGRHYLGWGIPPHFRQYDLNYMHWLDWGNHRVDYLSDTDVSTAASGAALAKAYDLMIFPGHHEYVTPREFQLVRAYRNRGGNLAYLSANNFFWNTVRHGDVLRRTAHFRSVGKPEDELMGDRYRANNEGGNDKPWVVVHEEFAPWLFAGTGLHNGSKFGIGGIEMDEVGPSAPRGTKVIAMIPGLMGHGRLNADMSYYERNGAKVFSAGAFTLAGEAVNPDISPLMDNLWRYMTKP